jgi:hypothetical protein
MKSLAKITVCVVLMFSALNMFAKNKDRALIVNNYGGDIYAQPNVGKYQTVKTGNSYCVVAGTSKDVLSSVSVCSQKAQDAYNSVKWAPSQTVVSIAQTDLDLATKTSGLKAGEIAVVTSSGVKSTPPVITVYKNKERYFAKNPGVKITVSCPDVA